MLLGKENTPPNTIIFPQLEFKILERSPSIFTNNNKKPENRVMVEIGIMNLCILGKRIDKDPALFIELNNKKSNTPP